MRYSHLQQVGVSLIAEDVETTVVPTVEEVIPQACEEAVETIEHATLDSGHESETQSAQFTSPRKGKVC